MDRLKKFYAIAGAITNTGLRYMKPGMKRIVLNENEFIINERIVIEAKSEKIDSRSG